MAKVILGIDRLAEFMYLFDNKRVGLITNPTGINSDFISTIDLFAQYTNLTALFSPEHGVRGNIQAGQKVESYIDAKTGTKVWTLYGKNKKPTQDMLIDVDILVYDIQDVGSRLYTYLYTLAYCMQACKEWGKEIIVFDRPNPVGGSAVEGNLVHKEFRSFIGLYPIPYRYGLTIGEIAMYFNSEFNINAQLTVVKMKNWTRDMYYDNTGLNWIMPSPNMPTLNTALLYNATCIFEGTNISEGRGTTIPFELVGAPWLNAEELAIALNEKSLPGIYFRPIYFTPTFSKYENQLCQGVQLHIINRDEIQPIKIALYLLKEIRQRNSDKFKFAAPYTAAGKPMIDYNTGSDTVRTSDFDPEALYIKWESENKQYKKDKSKYHLY
ncbi:exo-beta-N-acetylmuramidase NamZ domain-containing protein [Candidatus Epulonipiscium viviparus]|uniref:exo-beta-N-acetylmuramidase NamZ family protein n=1 Tax=Candidatus Epulonipiscium viviparus TaxID=420336 RepID=UPI00016BFC76|nr:DUF1343 domain-containing protein [Candidatus Epulopiscium viviparus]